MRTTSGHEFTTLWFLSGSRCVASARLQGHLVVGNLKRAQVGAQIVVQPPRGVRVLPDMPFSFSDLRAFDALPPNTICVIQKYSGPATQMVLEYCGKRGITTVFVDCDPPLKTPEARLATAVVCPTTQLRDAYLANGAKRAYVVPDPFEYSQSFLPVTRSAGVPLRGVWFGEGSDTKWRDINRVCDLLKATGFPVTVATISDHPNATIRWRGPRTLRLLNQFDVAILPGSGKEYEHRSPNRCVQAMAFGLPVLAGPIPSYRDIIVPGHNGFFCEAIEEWVGALSACRDHQVLERLRKSAWETVRTPFSPQSVASRWIAIFREILTDSSAGANPQGLRLKRAISDLHWRARRRIAGLSNTPLATRCLLTLSCFAARPFNRDLYAGIARNITRRVVTELQK